MKLPQARVTLCWSTWRKGSPLMQTSNCTSIETNYTFTKLGTCKVPPGLRLPVRPTGGTQMYLDTMTAIAKKAGKLLLDIRKQGFEVTNKSGLDPVTDADQASENLVIAELQAHFPDYSIMAEEQGWFHEAESEFTWIIDPLDGTANY